MKGDQPEYRVGKSVNSHDQDVGFQLAAVLLTGGVVTVPLDDRL
jgi:hypothetical protein